MQRRIRRLEKKRSPKSSGGCQRPMSTEEIELRLIRLGLLDGEDDGRPLEPLEVTDERHRENLRTLDLIEAGGGYRRDD